MNIAELQKKMGDATEQEAEVMADLLEGLGLSDKDTADIPEKLWLDLLETAVMTVAEHDDF